MADIDKRALMGMCAFNNPVGKQGTSHQPMKVLWCNKPRGTKDPLLCDYHADILYNADRHPKTRGARYKPKRFCRLPKR